MKPFLYLIIAFVLVSCNSISTPCYMGVLPFAERASFNDSLNLKLEKANQKKSLTETENLERLEVFKSNSTIAEKLVAIKNEIRAAKVYRFPHKRFKIDTEREYISSPAECEIAFRLGVRGEVYNLNYKWTESLDEKLQLLTAKNIDSITVLQGAIATNLYGTNGKCGVVILHSNNRKFKRKLSKL